MAVFTEAQLTPTVDGMSILDNAVYLESGSPIITTKTIPVVENSYVGSMIVRFSDVKSLSESYGISYLDAIGAIANDNNIDSNHLAVAVDEETIIEDPEIIDELANVVVNPISENSLAYMLCEGMVTLYEETGDEEYLAFLAEEDTMSPVQKANQKAYLNYVDNIDNMFDSAKAGQFSNGFTIFPSSDAAKKHLDISKKFSNVYLGTISRAISNKNPKMSMALNNLNKMIEKELDNAPRTWLAKKVVALRSLYAKYLAKARMAKDLGQAGVAKKIAIAILNVIDWIMHKLQAGANKVGTQDYRYSFGR